MVKVGIVGAGKRYKSFYSPVLEALNNEIKIVGFVTKSGKVSEDLQNHPVFSSLKQMCDLRKPDFIICITPPSVTMSILKEACSLGCNILVETPVGNLRDAREILNNIKKSGILAGTVEQWPFLPMECFKKKIIDSGILGNIHLAENDYRTYDYHGVSQLRNYLGKDANFSEIKGKTRKRYNLSNKQDIWDIILAELDNGTTLLYKYSSLYKRVEVRNFKSIRVYGSRGTIISDCLLDNNIEKLSIIWHDNSTHHLKIEKKYHNETIHSISTKLPDNTVIEWKNNLSDHNLSEHQIAISQHIVSMIDRKVLWTIEDGFKDLQIL